MNIAKKRFYMRLFLKNDVFLDMLREISKAVWNTVQTKRIRLLIFKTLCKLELTLEG